MTLGKKLQFLRNQKSISQEELALELGVSRQAVSKWELDASMPDTANVIHLCKFFSVSADYLLNEEVECDKDIPVVQKNTVELEGKFHSSMLTVSGILCTTFGCLGHLVFFLLSTMIQVPVLKETALADGSASYQGGADVLGYNYFAFIQNYRLQALCILFLFLIAIGIFLLVMRKNQKFQKRFFK